MADTDVVNWVGEWIWGAPATDGSEGGEGSRYHYFRRVIRLSDSVQSARMRVCADSRYRLWVNNHLVGHGPARSDPSYQYYDLYEFGSELRSGDNTIAMLATHYGIGTCFSRLGSPGLLVQLEVVLASGETVVYGSDATWKTLPAPYRTGVPRMSIQLAYPEIFDARDEPATWHFSGHDDGGWPNARVIGPVGTPPWTLLVPRDIPLPYFRTVAPVRIVQVNAVEWQDVREAELPDLRTPAEGMERATRLSPAPEGSVTHRHPALFTVAPQTGATGVSVVLDFGREVSGFPILVVRRSGGGRIDIGYSERIEEDGTVNPNRWGGCDVHYADRLWMRAGHQHYEPLDHRAFRYMRLDFYDCPVAVEILVEMRLSGYPVAPRGDFQCSDAILQKIWEVGRYTTELCMDDGFMDCPWRERGQWLGDARVEALVAAYAYGDTALARKALLQYPQSQEESGWFRGVFPSDPPFDAILPTFCLIWPVALWDYFVLTEDRTLLQAVWPALERLVATVRRHMDTDGLVGNLPGWVFVDWAKLNTAGQSTAVNAMAYDALQNAARVARAIGYPDRGSDWQILAGEIREAVNDMLWDRARDAYVDGIVNGERSVVISEQSNVLAALTGVADREQTAKILERVLAERDLDVRIATPYFAFYLLSLLYKEGRYEEALGYIRKRWRPMLEAGATTFWEQWESHWSLCHAWSAAPTHDLMAHVAGIKPTQPGFEEFDVHLQPCTLTWLRATVPTPRGDISVSYHRRREVPHADPTGSPIPLGAKSPAITVHLTIPSQSRAHIRVPLDGIPAPTIRLNGKPMWEAGKAIAPAGDKFIPDGDAVAFHIIGGRYLVEVERI